MKTTLNAAKRAAEILLRNERISNDGKIFGHCCNVYCSTNENASGYLPVNYRVVNKNVLSVTGSGDIPMEFVLRDANNIDCFDINALAEYMLRLKIASVLSLEQTEFIDFYNDTSNMKNCEKTFSYDMYINKIEKYLDKRTKEFWNHVYEYTSREPSLFPIGTSIRHSNLFATNYVDYHMLENRDSFVAKNNYYKLKQKLEKVEFNFIECSMIELSNFIGDKNYAAIYLSNIAEYLKDIYKANRLTQFKQFILDDLYSHLDDNGLLVGAYLFNILGGISDIDIYNPQKREKHLSDIFKMITFPSAMCFPYESTHGALVLTKKYNNRSNNAYN